MKQSTLKTEMKKTLLSLYSLVYQMNPKTTADEQLIELFAKLDKLNIQ